MATSLFHNLTGFLWQTFVVSGLVSYMFFLQIGIIRFIIMPSLHILSC